MPASDLLAEAQAVAEEISAKSRINTMAIKEAVNRAFETSLSEGLLFERRTFQALLAILDQKRGNGSPCRKASPSILRQMIHA
ncbi:hypothetical protein [Xanthobacter sp. YC-JY1]|uniref:hypothetical protein n=1 Tax=Xanthobacter sp. YC-JY1 TaxID=2419844 RepID=UPI00352EDF59